MRIKKFLVVCSCLVVMGTTQAFSIGLGASTTAPLGGFNGNNSLSGSILISFTDTLHLSVVIPDGAWGIGPGFDWWFLNLPMLSFNNSGSLNFYIGVGGQVAFFLGTGTFGLESYVRVPIGLDLKYPKFDLFFQVEPGLGIVLNDEEVEVGELYANGRLGFRYWFAKK